MSQDKNLDEPYSYIKQFDNCAETSRGDSVISFKLNENEYMNIENNECRYAQKLHNIINEFIKDSPPLLRGLETTYINEEKDHFLPPASVDSNAMTDYIFEILRHKLNTVCKQLGMMPTITQDVLELTPPFGAEGYVENNRNPDLYGQMLLAYKKTLPTGFVCESEPYATFFNESVKEYIQELLNKENLQPRIVADKTMQKFAVFHRLLSEQYFWIELDILFTAYEKKINSMNWPPKTEDSFSYFLNPEFLEKEYNIHFRKYMTYDIPAEDIEKNIAEYIKITKEAKGSYKLASTLYPIYFSMFNNIIWECKYNMTKSIIKSNNCRPFREMKGISEIFKLKYAHPLAEYQTDNNVNLSILWQFKTHEAIINYCENHAAFHCDYVMDKGKDKGNKVDKTYENNIYFCSWLIIKYSELYKTLFSKNFKGLYMETDSGKFNAWYMKGLKYPNNFFTALNFNDNLLNFYPEIFQSYENFLDEKSEIVLGNFKDIGIEDWDKLLKLFTKYTYRIEDFSYEANFYQQIHNHMTSLFAEFPKEAFCSKERGLAFECMQRKFYHGYNMMRFIEGQDNEKQAEKLYKKLCKFNVSYQNRKKLLGKEYPF